MDPNDDDIPVLTEVVDPGSTGTEPAVEPPDFDTLMAELQTHLAASAFELTERLLHSAFAEMEATIFEQVSNRLRQELPELVDRILREHLEGWQR